MAVHVTTLALASACLVVAATPATAQTRTSPSSFTTGYNDIGPVIGLGSLDAGGVSFGGRFEHAIQPLPSLGNGMLGFQAAVDYHTASYDYGFGTFSGSSTITEFFLGATANYHFKLDDPQWDPFIGLGLGYRSFSCSTGNSIAGFTGNYCGSYGTAIFPIGRLGARYFFSPKMAVYADAGAGGATINLGVMLKLK
jgi:hypothetical protein